MARKASRKASKKTRKPTAKKARKKAPAKRAGGARGKGAGGNIIPAMRYRDAPAAIEFLCQAFGFKRHLVVPGENGGIAHAQLQLHNGMIMLGSITDSEFGRLMKQPDEAGGQTQTAYIVVSDVDAHYRRAVAAGAAIVIDITDQDYGGRDYTCRDPEGYIWTFGSYDPWRV